MNHIHLVTKETIYLVARGEIVPGSVLTSCCKEPVCKVMAAGGKVTKYQDIATCGPLRKETASMKEKS